VSGDSPIRFPYFFSTNLIIKIFFLFVSSQSDWELGLGGIVPLTGKHRFSANRKVHGKYFPNTQYDYFISEKKY